MAAQRVLTISGGEIQLVDVDLSSKQNLDAGLTSLAGLVYASAAFVKYTGADTFTLDTTTYQPSWVSGQAYAIISCPLSGFTSTATSATLVNYTDMLCNISDFPAGATAALRVIWTNNTASRTNNISLYDQLGAADIASSTASQAIATPGTYQITEVTGIVLPTGLKSFMVKVWQTGGAGTITVSGVALQIEKP
jgi:hypothetical protein